MWPNPWFQGSSVMISAGSWVGKPSQLIFLADKFSLQEMILGLTEELKLMLEIPPPTQLSHSKAVPFDLMTVLSPDPTISTPTKFETITLDEKLYVPGERIIVELFPAALIAFPRHV